MQKKFNITGTCRPNQHYMADISHKLASTIELVESNEYFIINRPRQYGKTTMLYTLEAALMKRGDYMVFNISFEGIGDAIFTDEKLFAPGFIRLLIEQANYHTPVLVPFLKEIRKDVGGMDDLSDAITAIAAQTDKKLVVLIDEVDKSSNNQLFISFLAMLRNRYLMQDRIKTFHSIVLAGVHDVKTLKMKIRPDEEQKYNSPWNIAADFKVDMNLNPHEIVPMLVEYAADKNVKMDAQKIAVALFYYTSGYPFLVSKLCKMLDEDFLKHDEWTEHDVEIAAKELVKQENTNFQSLVKNIEHSREFYDWVYYVAVDGNSPSFSALNPLTNWGVLCGIFTKKDDRLVIHNRIYAEVLVDYMRERLLQQRLYKKNEFGHGYKNDDDSLDMQAVMLGFQAFMKKEYSRKDRDFLEKNGRLVFLAFLKPIINGSGYDFKEPQISDEKRLDVVITHLNNKYVAELKLWRGAKAHEKGLVQLADYLDRQNLHEGYLLIFDHSEIKNWQSEELVVNSKTIFAVWV